MKTIKRRNLALVSGALLTMLGLAVTSGSAGARTVKAKHPKPSTTQGSQTGTQLFFGIRRSSSKRRSTPASTKPNLTTAISSSTTAPPGMALSAMSLLGANAPTDAGQILSSSPFVGGPSGSSGYNIKYRSYSISGKPIEVTGLAFVPKGKAPTGGWPMLAYAHGTVGIADQCAPSKNFSSLESGLVVTLNALGIAVVQSDYEGLGTPGRHPYLVGVSEGRGLLDAAKAMKNLPGETLSKKLLIWGHSQGGHAALFGGELAPKWAPQLDLKGVVAGAPPSTLELVPASMVDSPYRGYLMMVVAGMAEAYPSLKPEAVLTSVGMKELPIVDSKCNEGIFQEVNKFKLSELMTVTPQIDPTWAAVLKDNDPGAVKIPAPVLIIHGDQDEQVPVETSATLMTRLCATGTVTERRVYKDQNHGGAALASLFDVTTWLGSRLIGLPATNGCRK